MQRHDRHFFALLLGVVIHDQADMLQEPLQILEILQSLHQFLDVLQPPRCLWRLIVLPKPSVAALIQDHASQFDMGVGLCHHLRMPTVQALDQYGQLFEPLTAQKLTLANQPRALNQVHTILTRCALNGLHGLIA